MHGDIIKWVSGMPTFCPSMYATSLSLLSDLTQWCFSAPESEDNALTTSKQANMLMIDANLTLLLGECARATLVSGSWKDTLVATSSVSILFSTICLICLALGFEFTMTGFNAYCAICEHLEGINHIMDAAECFHNMESEIRTGQTGQADAMDHPWVASHNM